ncbi:MAG: CarD family transcriptional regulator, partial [Gammaproteobacteria bacterium]
MARPVRLLNIPDVTAAGQATWGQLYGSARALALTELAAGGDGPVLVIAPEPRSADRLRDEIAFFADDRLEVLLLPDSEALPYDAFSPHPDITSQRLRTLSRLPDLRNGVAIVALPTMMQRLPPVEWVLGSSLDLSVGQRLDSGAFRARLASGGYTAVSQVTEHGEFTVRGSIIDIFPMGSDRPFRVDLLDDEIESIRTFDPDTQRSQAHQQRASVLPAREFPFTREAIDSFRERFRRMFPVDLSRVSVYTDVAEGIAPGGIEFYLPLFYDALNTLADYLPESCRVVTVGDPVALADQVWREVAARYEQLRHDLEQPRLAPGDLYATPDEIMEIINARPGARLETFEQEVGGWNAATATLPPLKLASSPGHPSDLLERFMGEFPGRVLFTAESPGRREMLRELLSDRGLAVPIVGGWHEFLASSARTGLAIAPLEQGFQIGTHVAVVPESELLGERGRQRRRRRQRDPEVLINQLTDLETGAPVVHEEYGVGRFLGLEHITAGGHSGEFLALEYAGGDKLYVPVQSLERITRYAGAAPENAPLHRLGSDQWTRARQRAAKRVRDVAAELLDVYARRAARSGSQLRYQEPDYRAFCEEFPFEETPDQADTIEQVLADLAAPQSMDRVVCGDVGFGKTEVALRAAFAAVQGGRQAAILV